MCLMWGVACHGGIKGSPRGAMGPHEAYAARMNLHQVIRGTCRGRVQVGIRLGVGAGQQALEYDRNMRALYPPPIHT